MVRRERPARPRGTEFRYARRLRFMPLATTSAALVLLLARLPSPALSQGDGGDDGVGPGEVTSARPNPDPGCFFGCAHDGVCQLGEASFPDALRYAHSGWTGDEWEVIPFLKDLNDGRGEYCWCPEGLTGYGCTHEYEWCWVDVGDDGIVKDGFACFHGAVCTEAARWTDGNDKEQIEYFCDCSHAKWTDGSDRGMFAGLHCEHEASEVCKIDGTDNPIGFCVNEGNCKPGETRQNEMCECPDGWRGPHCEYRGENAPPSTVDDVPSKDAQPQSGVVVDVEFEEAAPEPADDCGLDCPNGGVCQKGRVNFPDNLMTDYNGGTIPFLQRTTNGAGEYCWCPEGWTGYMCRHHYQYCWEEPNGPDGEFGDGYACFHGGTCKKVQGTQRTYLCDCASAADSDGNDRGLFAGAHCEHKASIICVDDVSGDPVGFCTNGGSCVGGETDQTGMCDCPSSWTGPHCEFKVDTFAATSSTTTAAAPGAEDLGKPNPDDDCSLDCANGGVCQKGEAEFPSALMITSNNAITPFLKKTEENEEYCWCPPGWTGYDCSHEYNSCWERRDGHGNWIGGFACFHGGKCKSVPGGSPTDYVCDCTSASVRQDKADKGQFAGAHCEYSAAQDEGAECHQGGNPNLPWVGFCVNGGTCNPLESVQSRLCECNDEWTGPHCEFYTGMEPEPTAATTAAPNDDADQGATGGGPPQSQCNDGFCWNGGVCRTGTAPPFPDSLATTAEGTPVPFMFSTQSDEFQYCWCPDGWTGFDCFHQYEYCHDPLKDGDGTDKEAFACFHGGKCAVMFEGDGNDHSICDCTKAQIGGKELGLFAGKHCEFRATDVCYTAEKFEVSWNGFCVNGGSCVEGEKDQSKMCECPEGWTGSHCEIVEDPTKPQPPPNCSLECSNGGVCQEGQAEYDLFFDPGSDGDSNEMPIPFFQAKSNGEGEYCWCPDGWTGVNCDHKYKFCGDRPYGFACYHDAECLYDADSDAYSCDCSKAHFHGADEGLFAGSQCQLRATEACLAKDLLETVGFCVNGGSCFEVATDVDHVCNCLHGFSGKHCEERASSKPERPPNCSLECPNGGVCQKGEADFGTLAHPSDGNDIPGFLVPTSNPNGEYCWCPDGWTSFSCEHKYEFCGDKGFACFHDAECIYDEDSGAHSCECSQAHFKGEDKGLFAGTQCQLRASEECLAEDMKERVGFCVNGGTCKKGATDQNVLCHCDEGFGGPHCEVPASQFAPNTWRPNPAPDCDLTCANDGVCQKGTSDHYGLISPDNYNYSSPIFFLQNDSDGNGQYCWCPEGFTGVDCAHKYEICDPQNADEESRGFSCFHSSKCTDLGMGGLQTWACDCSTATNNEGEDKGFFAGRYCEHEVTEKCEVLGTEGGLSEKEWFCVNGGTCQEGESNPYKICNCPAGWTGPHCEYAKKSVASTQFKPKECYLSCRNGGTCVHGVKDYGDHADSNKAKELSWLNDTHVDQMHCVCPTGYTGLLCQIESEKCGEKLWCYNGAQCKKTTLEDGSTKKYCDCAEAATEEASFAGIGCQHKSGVFCDPDSGMSKDMSFCVNGGNCFETGKGHLGCDCPDDWEGQHCEFHKSESKVYSDPKKCDLECKNGGTCSVGVKNYGKAGLFNLTFAKNRHVDFEHCICPVGYSGLDCSIKFDVCDDSHVCPYGSKCEVKGKTDSGKKLFSCICDGARNENGNSVAGKFCEHEATEYCVSGSSSWHSFCTNGGKCVAQISAKEDHPGCQCPSGWIGDHCEFRVKASVKSSTTQETRNSMQPAILFSIMVAFIVVVIATAVLLTKRFATAEALQREEIRQQGQMQGGNSDDTFDAEGDHGHEGDKDDGPLSDVDIL